MAVWRRTRTVALILALALLTACSRDTVNRAEWQHLSHDDRILYVKSLVGAEKAKDAKGGGGKNHTRTAEEYVRSIDTAYARGDQREVHDIFKELPD